VCEQRADVRDCDVLERVTDYAQCAWDDGWLTDFQRDFEDNGGQFSVSERARGEGDARRVWGERGGRGGGGR
jgi:hypothetical protein